MTRTDLLLVLVLLAGCSGNLREHPRTASYKVIDPYGSSLRTAAASAAAEHPGGRSGVRLLENGPDAFAMRALLTMRAEQTLDVQAYLVHDGLTTRVLMHLVLEAAERGVRVRILLDDTASRGNDFATATLAAHPNIEVRLFNPMHAGRENIVTSSVMLLTHLNRLHRRMHNKLWVVDNAVAITGGRNLGDEYFGAAADVNFADIDVLLAGPVVEELSSAFDTYWNSDNAVPVEAFLRTRPGRRHFDRLRERLQQEVNHHKTVDSPYLERLRARDDQGYLSFDSEGMHWAPVQAVWDDPAKVDSPGIPPENQLLASALAPHFAAIERELVLVSAYFVPGLDGVSFLSTLAQRDVQVRVLTNSLQSTDVPFAHGAYVRYRAPLLDAGVGLHELKARLPLDHPTRRFGIRSHWASLHTKAMVFDEDTAFIGSFNFDPRSRFWNTELGVVVHSAEFARELQAVLAGAFDPAASDRAVLRDRKVRFEILEDGRLREKRRPWATPWRRFQSWLSGRLAPESMM